MDGKSCKNAHSSKPNDHKSLIKNGVNLSVILSWEFITIIQ